MVSKLRLPVVGLSALLLVPSCANHRAVGSSDPAWAETGEENAPGAVSLSSEEQSDLDCAGQVRTEKRRICDDAPPALPESYTSRSRATLEGLEERCGAGMRARAALRELDDCLFALEEDPTQIDLGTKARRGEASGSVAALKEDPLYPHARRRLKEARQEADLAAQDYEQALRGFETESKVRFRADAWEQAENDLRSARRRLVELATKYSIDARDARALGIW